MRSLSEIPSVVAQRVSDFRARRVFKRRRSATLSVSVQDGYARGSYSLPSSPTDLNGFDHACLVPIYAHGSDVPLSPYSSESESSTQSRRPMVCTFSRTSAYSDADDAF